MKNSARDGKDRRSFERPPPFPFRDSEGHKVCSDRRVTPCRRLNSITPEWISMAEFLSIYYS